MKNADIIGFGELLIRMTATSNEPFERLMPFTPYVGGAEANVLAGLSRLGHHTKMISVLPDNLLADGIVSELNRWGVDTKDVARSGQRVGLYYFSPGSMQRPSSIVYDRKGSSFAELDPTQFDWEVLLKDASWFHVSGVTAALGPRVYQAALEGMKAARKMGVSVAYDGNFRPSLWADWQADAPSLIYELMEQADLMFAGYRDIALVTGEEVSGEGLEREQNAAKRAFERFAHLGHMASTTRQTISADHNILSAQSFWRGGQAVAPALDLIGIIDRIGGGDAFCVGFYDGLIRGLSPDETIKTALAVGALKHAQCGDLCLVSRKQLDAFMAEGGFDVQR